MAWAREKAGLTKRELAGMVGVSEQLMGEMESGWRSATAANLVKIAKVLNCPLVVLERPADEAAAYGTRIQDLEAFAFRSRTTLIDHSEHLASLRNRPTSAPGTSTPGTAAPDCDTLEQRLGVIERVLFALARAQGIDAAAE
ncbi:helix-turn-helix domain-containing protein [Streptomyces sp. NBC_01476]|uniref:helix-turn-helix domain-containing protein n=1 Tax=Streptomyces sp. NBC_01476 TaxID=2903881 RepID=UPI002E37A6B4|nr:helix-turn-helix transcriptional regulator [Streptomyces sp. NBC_01476]